ncbi:Maturase [Dirofilaria immitis]
MKLQLISFLITIIYQNIAISNNTTETLCQILSIQLLCDQTVQYLENEDLENMLNVSVFKGCATTELFNRLYKIAYIRQGELFPKRWVLDHWESLHSPNKISWPAFLFLGNISRNEYLRNLLFTKNRTKCLQLCRNRATRKISISTYFQLEEFFPATSVEHKIDGFILPRPLINRIVYIHLRLENSSLLIEEVKYDQIVLYMCDLWGDEVKFSKGPIKLILNFFAFTNDNPKGLTHSEVESITQDCINTVDSQICIASETSFDMPGANYVYRNEIVIFGGENVEASTFVVKTDNEAELREQFEQWNTETISSWYNYQKIAIHITSTHFIEPKNSENLFNEVFNDVKLTTRYLSNNSASSVLSSCDGFQRGSIYAIIGFRNK